MKTINDILKKYDDEIEKVTELDNFLETKRKLELTSHCINNLREEIRKKRFPFPRRRN